MPRRGHPVGFVPVSETTRSRNPLGALGGVCVDVGRRQYELLAGRDMREHFNHLAFGVQLVSTLRLDEPNSAAKTIALAERLAVVDPLDEALVQDRHVEGLGAVAEAPLVALGESERCDLEDHLELLLADRLGLELGHVVRRHILLDRKSVV